MALSCNFDTNLIEHYKSKCGIWVYSIKHDGIRVMTTDSYPLTRNGKRIPNRHLEQMLMQLPAGLHGEISAIDHSRKDAMKVATSIVMTKHITLERTLELLQEAKYYVFDYTGVDNSYLARLAVAKANIQSFEFAEVVKVYAADMDTIYDYGQSVEGEGLIVAADVPYFDGRCNKTNPWSLKVKRVADCESTIVGIETECYGHNLKSVPEELWGTEKHQVSKLILHNDQFGEHRAGGGLSLAEKKDIYANPNKYIGRVITIEYMHFGSDKKPRQPRVKDIRGRQDL